MHKMAVTVDLPSGSRYLLSKRYFIKDNPVKKCLPMAMLLWSFVAQGAAAVNTPPTFSQEADYPIAIKGKIAEFWQRGQFNSFQGKDDKRINYAQFTNSKHQAALLISPGRTESYLKYQEVIFDLFHQGYDIFIIDHRGQGLSERLLDEHDKGYVANFDDYAEDLAQFVEKVISPQSNKPLYLLAHSMGSAIAIRYFQQFDHPIKAAVLASPMIAFNRGGLPFGLASAVIHSGDRLNLWLGQRPWYFFGQSDFEPLAFADNPLSQSEHRFNHLIGLYQQNRVLQLGGATFHWLSQAQYNTERMFKDLPRLTVPIMVLQAGADTVVDNELQNRFCQQLHQHVASSCPNGKPITIDGARHELLIEADRYRHPALSETLNWFKHHGAVVDEPTNAPELCCSDRDG